MDSAAPRVGLAPKLGFVPVLIPLRLTMVQTVGDQGTKHRIVLQDHAQVNFLLISLVLWEASYRYGD